MLDRIGLESFGKQLVDFVAKLNIEPEDKETLNTMINAYALSYSLVAIKEEKARIADLISRL